MTFEPELRERIAGLLEATALGVREGAVTGVILAAKIGEGLVEGIAEAGVRDTFKLLHTVSEKALECGCNDPHCPKTLMRVVMSELAKQIGQFEVSVTVPGALVPAPGGGTVQ